jgi:hypothetical protein
VSAAEYRRDDEPSPVEILTALSCGRSRCECVASARRGHGLTHAPCHPDSTPSLNVTPGTKRRTVVRCHAGCDQGAVISALRERGIWPRNDDTPHQQRRREPPVTVEALAAEKGLPTSFLAEVGVSPAPDGRGVLITYRDGDRVVQKRRTTLRANGGSYWPKGTPLMVYGADRLDAARSARRLLLGEGESDGWTSWYHGEPYLGLPGAGTARTLEARHLEGIDRLDIIHERDDGGDKFVAGGTLQIADLGWSGQAYDLRLDVKDLNELHLKHGGDRAAFLAALERARAEAKPITLAEPVRPPYRRTAAGMVWLKPTRDGEILVPLSNFAASIVSSTIEDDGVELRCLLEIEASLGDRTRQFPVSPDHFAGRAWWIENLSPRAIVLPQGREHFRVAVQATSNEIAERVVKTHTGWTRIDGQPVYLTASGAIGAEGLCSDVEVSLCGGLARFDLPASPEGDQLAKAVGSSLLLTRVAPDRIVVPNLGAAYRAPLGTCDFGVWFVGPTGVGKTELAALAQQHYGARMNARGLPGSWSSTGNALERLAFEAKDALLAVDDFAPTGSVSDVQRFHRDADRLNRAQGNNAGRARLRPDGTLKAANPPRGLVVSTGEDQPRNQSARARNLIVEVGPRDVNFARLTRAQRLAGEGVYALAMAGYVRWLAGRYDMIAPTIAADLVRFREAAQASAVHRRTPEITAQLAIGWRWWLSYAVEVGAIEAADAPNWWGRVWHALGEAAGEQAQHQQASDPVVRYLQLLAGALAAGSAHVADAKGDEPAGAKAWGWRQKEISAGDSYRVEWQPQGKRIGWLDKDGLFLEQEAAFAGAQDMGIRTNDPLAVGSRTLARRLDERGLLLSTDRARNRLTVYRQLEGTRRYVLHLRTDVFSAGVLCVSTTDTSDTSDTPPPRTPRVPIWSGVTESTK